MSIKVQIAMVPYKIVSYLYIYCVSIEANYVF